MEDSAETFLFIFTQYMSLFTSIAAIAVIIVDFWKKKFPLSKIHQWSWTVDHWESNLENFCKTNGNDSWELQLRFILLKYLFKNLFWFSKVPLVKSLLYLTSDEAPCGSVLVIPRVTSGVTSSYIWCYFTSRSSAVWTLAVPGSLASTLPSGRSRAHT